MFQILSDKSHFEIQPNLNYESHFRMENVILVLSVEKFVSKARAHSDLVHRTFTREGGHNVIIVDAFKNSINL